MIKHPIVEFLKYTVLITTTLYTQQPLLVGFLFILSQVISRGRLWVVNLWVIVALLFINSFSSLDGVTFLAYHNYHIITLEAVIYGGLSGLRMATLLNVCWKFSQDVRSEKLVVVTSYLAPPLSLLISMTVRNVRRYSEKLKEIYSFQSSLQEDENIIVKFKIAFKSVSILIDWALENGFETSQSMKLRHFGEHRRTAYRPIKLSIRDLFEVILILLWFLIYLLTRPHIQIIPELQINFSALNAILLWLFIIYIFKEDLNEVKNRKDDL